MLTQEQGKKLLKLARDSIKTSFERKTPDIPSYKEFSEKQGVFVTLTKEGELRGCIGFPEPIDSLNKLIVEAARAAAFQDPRFPSLRKEELKEIKIEISVLTVPKIIEVKKPGEYLKKIKIGEDGLIIMGEYGSGLLLPQVFREYKCTPLQALQMTCEKAGLDIDSWKDLKNKIYKFQAQIFSEE